MRFFGLFITVSAIVISVTASVNQKRELSTEFQTCSKDVNSHIQLMKNYAAWIDNYKDGSEGFLEQNPKLFKSFMDCCDYAVPNMNYDDNNAVPGLISSILDSFDSFVKSSIHKEADLNRQGVFANIVYNFALDTKIATKGLLKCFAPANKSYLDRLNNSYNEFKKHYYF